LVDRLDTDFVNPNKAAVSDVSPASISHGVTPVPSTGTDAHAVRCDVQSVMGTFIEANNPLKSGVWVMSANRALALSLMRNALGQPEFPGITVNGGTFAGLPVIVSQYTTADSRGDFVFLLNAGDIYLGDEGGVQIDMSEEASLQMLDNPTNDSTTPTPTQLVSMFQTNSVAFRAERTINWKKRRTSAVGVIDSVNWGNCS
jgi:HK97 family phage major capsid protein